MGFNFAKISMNKESISIQNQEVLTIIEDFKNILYNSVDTNSPPVQGIIDNLAETLSWHFASMLKYVLGRGRIVYIEDTNSCWFLDTDGIAYNIATYSFINEYSAFVNVDRDREVEAYDELLDSVIFPTMFDNIGLYYKIYKYCAEIVETTVVDQMELPQEYVTRYSDIVNILARFMTVFSPKVLDKLFVGHCSIMFAGMLKEVAGFGKVAKSTAENSTNIVWFDPESGIFFDTKGMGRLF